MTSYTKECLEFFLNDQGQLFDEPVVDNLEEAETFLEDCFAVVLDSPKEIMEYFEEGGVDVLGMTEDEVIEASEVFVLPSGKYLVVEG
jgi:hypothetical protein